MIYHRSLMQNLNSFCCNMRSTTNSEWYHISWCCNTMWDFANDTFGWILLKKYLDTYLIISTYAYCILQCTVGFPSTSTIGLNQVTFEKHGTFTRIWMHKICPCQIFMMDYLSPPYTMCTLHGNWVLNEGKLQPSKLSFMQISICHQSRFGTIMRIPM